MDDNERIRSNNHVVGQAFSSFKHFFKRLISRKSMEQLQSEIETKNEMRRTLNSYQLAGIGLGTIIGK
jgi:hypothetical protein